MKSGAGCIHKKYFTVHDSYLCLSHISQYTQMKEEICTLSQRKVIMQDFIDIRTYKNNQLCKFYIALLDRMNIFIIIITIIIIIIIIITLCV
jgi:hypothetical protein